MEAARADWFAAFAAQRERVQPGPLCGQLSNPALIAALAPRLPGSRARPLSASALEDYARCPFRFFVYRVLGAAPIPEGGDDLDPLARGNLYHKVLETFFAERRDHGKLPLSGGDDDRQALEQALATALEEFTAAERGGHPGLFQIRLRRLRAELWQLITREAQAPIEAGCTPALFEHKFGPLAITAAEETDPDGALHIGGVIDRIDLGPGRALVLDYKTGRMQRYQHYLREELLKTSFQLPLYAAAAQADPVILQATAADALSAAPPRVTARYYAVREAQVTEALDDQVLVALDPATRLAAGEHNVAEAAYKLWRRLRGGDFRVAPRTCDGCGLETVCRIAVPSVDGEAGDETPEADSSSSSSSSASSSSKSAASPVPPVSTEE
jgi:RecB family exonuclease